MLDSPRPPAIPIVGRKSCRLLDNQLNRSEFYNHLQVSIQQRPRAINIYWCMDSRFHWGFSGRWGGLLSDYFKVSLIVSAQLRYYKCSTMPPFAFH